MGYLLRGVCKAIRFYISSFPQKKKLISANISYPFFTLCCIKKQPNKTLLKTDPFLLRGFDKKKWWYVIFLCLYEKNGHK